MSVDSIEAKEMFLLTYNRKINNRNKIIININKIEEVKKIEEQFLFPEFLVVN